MIKKRKFYVFQLPEDPLIPAQARQASWMRYKKIFVGGTLYR
jgi:hypothetical protein